MLVTGKKVLVFGSGISGIGAVKLLEDHGAEVVLYDGNESLDQASLREQLGEKTTIVLGEFPEHLLEELELVVLSPGVPTDLPVILAMKEHGIQVIGEVSLHMRSEREMCLRSQERMERQRQHPCLVRL